METDSLLFANVNAAFDERNWMFREVSGREVVEAEFEAHHGRVRQHLDSIPPPLPPATPWYHFRTVRSRRASPLGLELA